MNNSLEQVLSKKSFSVETKNILLSMFYKIENGYNDYKTVKRDTYEKKVYIQKLIDIINKDCEKIEFLKQNDKSKEVVNKEKKEIICYPIETQILYLLAKIQKKNVIVKYIDYYLEKAFSFVLNTGNNINIVEPLRDFNGFSWNVVSKDIEDINCNIIYQDMIFLMGNEFWKNQIEQINVLPDLGIEIIPRVGDHVVYVGHLPQTKMLDERQKLVSDFINGKLARLEKFYRYGLSQAGWNKYAYINLEFDNQIICKKRKQNQI